MIYGRRKSPAFLKINALSITLLLSYVLITLCVW